MPDRLTMFEAETYLNALPRFSDRPGAAYKPGLERIAMLLDAMGSPQESFDSIHVAGTNGKGSTASMIAAIGTASGLRVGLHTSPHLFHVTERMRIDGKPSPGVWLWNAIAHYRDLADTVHPSYFEFTVALSLLFFADEEVDIAVVEVGMGGRLDATNILKPVLSVITDIGLDHTEHLGTTVEEIASEKAGIIKAGVPVVTSTNPQAARIIEKAAARTGSEFHDAALEVQCRSVTFDVDGCRFTAETPLRRYDNLYVQLSGDHQLQNARIALRASELVYHDVHRHARPVFDGMRHVRDLSGLRGRLEVLRSKPLIVADVAHNAPGIAAALKYLEDVIAVEGQLHVLIGIMRDKDVQGIARILAAAHVTVRPVRLSAERALSAEELVSMFQVNQVVTEVPCTVEEGVRDFLAKASFRDALLITGSHLVISALESVSL